jgi:hypothetical protein
MAMAGSAVGAAPSLTLTGLERRSRPLPSIPKRYILLVDDFGRPRVLASPLPDRQLPVVSAYTTRAKDSVITVRYLARSLSQIRHSQPSRRGGVFYSFPPSFPAR